MKSIFGPLGALALIVGAVMAFDGCSSADQVDLLSGIALIVSGLTLLVLHEVIGALMKIEDKAAAKAHPSNHTGR